MKAILFFVLASAALAEDAPTPELDAAKARITWLEQTLAAMTKKSQACFDIYNADMAINALARQEPKAVDPATGAATSQKTPVEAKK